MSALRRQCAEGFLRAALKAEAATVMGKLRDGETAAKKLCKNPSRSGGNFSKTAKE